MENIKHPFEPIIDKECNILILGSFPSIKSRENKFYYMHPQNRFYKLLSKIYNEDFVNADINMKKKLLLENHIAIYDVIESCEIINSDDNKIKNVKYVDVLNLLKNCKIKKIYLNGKKAYELFIKKYPKLQDMAYYLPSTSPANAAFSFDKLYQCWKVIKD